MSWKQHWAGGGRGVWVRPHLPQKSMGYFWRASCNKLVSDFLGQIFVLVQMSSIFACDLGLNGKTLPRNFFCCFVFRFQEIFLNQYWQQMRASLILLFGKTKAFFGKDTTRKKLRFCTRYLWKRKEKPANLNRGVCFSMKWKATCQNWAHLDKEKKFRPKKSLTSFLHEALQFFPLTLAGSFNPLENILTISLRKFCAVFFSRWSTSDF